MVALSLVQRAKQYMEALDHFNLNLILVINLHRYMAIVLYLRQPRSHLEVLLIEFYNYIK